MRVLIDQERMVLLRKHQDLFVLANLAVIECGPDVAYCIISSDDATDFKTFTDMELKQLYLNLTKEEDFKFNFNRPQLLQVIVDAIARIPLEQIDFIGTETQAEWVESKRAKEEYEGESFRFVDGASRPAILPDLYHDFVHPYAPRNEIEEQTALTGRLPALQRAKLVAKPATGENTVSAYITQQAKAANAPRPKRGAAKPRIWAMADKMWEEAGKPTDKEQVLALRKDIMAALETEEGIRRTSSSSELGQWHKTRAPY